jgi:TRAP-type mannitol/chloroaromatic compound transport system permease small subunit
VQVLLKLSDFIDRLNEWCGRVFVNLVLVAVLISAGNAIVRKAFHVSSNAFLEAQWYLFGAIFLLCAGYALKRNAHVRIDVIIGRFSGRTYAWIDIVGSLLFLLPLCVLVTYFSWTQVVKAWTIQEMSSDAGGLIRWPVLLLIPVGFALLGLQGISIVIKNVAFLRGLIPFPYEHKEKSDEEALIEDLKSRQPETK